MLKESGDVMEQYFKAVEKLSQKEGGEWKKVVDRINRIVAAFWGAFCLGRLVAIPVSGRVRPLLVVFSACALSVVAVGQ